MTDFNRSDRLLFVADAHLGAFSTSKNQALEQSLIRLIDFCEENCYKIHVLGDLFDYWMEYPDYHPPLAENLLKRFRRYHQSFSSTLFITGNHDNWTWGYLSSLGFDIEPGTRNYTIDGQKLMLLHGDGLPDPENGSLKRPLLHQILRNKYFINCYQTLLPPRLGISVMRAFSRISRTTESGRMEKQTLNQWAKHYLSHTNTDIIITGHDHFPRIKTIPSGTFINTGAYYKDKTVVTYNNGHFDLVIWNDKLRELQPYKSLSRVNE